MANKESVQALLELIVSSTQDSMKAYDRSGQDLPSLDDTTPSLLPPEDLLALRRSLRVLEAACRQLCATLAPPSLTMFTRTTAHIDMALLKVVVNTKIADVLPPSPDGLPIEVLAEKSHTNPKKLFTVMRTLAATHCFREVRPGVFSNNSLSMTLRSDHPMHFMVKQCTNTFLPRCCLLAEAMLDPMYGPSFDATRSTFAFSMKGEHPNSTFYDFLKNNPQDAKTFNKSLSLLFTITEADSVISDFPWSELPSGSSVCDVGSGIGTVGLQLAKLHPHLRMTLQDLPNVTSQAEEIWKDQSKGSVHEDTLVRFIPFNFFQEGPVMHQDIYFIRQCMHNWTDEDCVAILENVRSSMKSSSRILIHEYIMRPSVVREDDSKVNSAPWPLLPNYGCGSIGAHHQDASMLLLLNASERTLNQYIALGARAGLRFVTCWEMLETGLMEFVSHDS